MRGTSLILSEFEILRQLNYQWNENCILFYFLKVIFLPRINLTHALCFNSFSEPRYIHLRLNLKSVCLPVVSFFFSVENFFSLEFCLQLRKSSSEKAHIILKYWYLRHKPNRMLLKYFTNSWSPDFFQASSFQLLKIHCDDHSLLSSNAVQIWIISYTSHH